MATLKDSLNKGLTALNVKTNNFMEQTKCKTYISTLENEIRELKLQIGTIVYEKRINGEIIETSVDDLIEQIHGKHEEINVQQQRIAQIIQEEQNILGTAQHHQDTPMIFCSQCGGQNASNYKFCCKCGAPLNA